MDCHTYLPIYLNYPHMYALKNKDANVVSLFILKGKFSFLKNSNLSLLDCQKETSFPSQTTDLGFSDHYIVLFLGANGCRYN